MPSFEHRGRRPVVDGRPDAEAPPVVLGLASAIQSLAPQEQARRGSPK